MKIFELAKILRNILQRLKSNVGIFRVTIYLFNPKIYNKMKLKYMTFSITKKLRLMGIFVQIYRNYNYWDKH